MIQTNQDYSNQAKDDVVVGYRKEVEFLNKKIDEQREEIRRLKRYIHTSCLINKRLKELQNG